MPPFSTHGYVLLWSAVSCGSLRKVFDRKKFRGNIGNRLRASNGSSHPNEFAAVSQRELFVSAAMTMDDAPDTRQHRKFQTRQGFLRLKRTGHRQRTPLALDGISSAQKNRNDQNARCRGINGLADLLDRICPCCLILKNSIAVQVIQVGVGMGSGPPPWRVSNGRLVAVRPVVVRSRGERIALQRYSVRSA